MNFTNLHKKLSLAALAGGFYYLATDPAVLALLPAPWGMIIAKFVAGVTVGGVAYNIDPKKAEAK